MIEVYTLESTPYIDTPYHLLGWIGWFVIAATILWVLRQNWSVIKVKHFWFFVILLLGATIFTNLIMGLRIPFGEGSPLPNALRENATPLVMLMAVLPIFIAAGFLGSGPAVIIGFAGGITNALWNTHSVFTPLEASAAALLISLAIRQNYRTWFFNFLRQPIGAGLITILISAPLILVSTFFSTNGSLAARLDYSFTQSWVLMVINGIQIVIAAVVVEIFSLRKMIGWVKYKSLRPSPIETGLQNRILFTALPMVLILLFTLAIADWMVAGKAAREMMENQLEGTANIAVKNIPSILETGQSLATSLVEQPLALQNKSDLQQQLKNKIREIPFFTQLFVFDLTGTPLTGYPAKTVEQLRLSAEEQSAIQLALNGVLIQHYIIPPNPGDESAQIAFIASIPDEYGLSKGVVVARTNFSINLFTKPALLTMDNILQSGGSGAILDEFNRVLFHTNPNLVMSDFTGKVPDVSGYYEDHDATGIRQLVYTAVDPEKGWKVILSLPASYAQDLALRIAVPLLAISLTISFLAYFLLHIMVKTLTKSLTGLAKKADEISNGEMDEGFKSTGVDEIGRLSSAFEQMRISLKSKLDELDTLLSVSQGMSQSFDVRSASIQFLKALLTYGADSASLVLINKPVQGWEYELTPYRIGTTVDEYSYLDRSILELLKDDNLLIIPSKTRIKRMGLPKSIPIPSALAAVALRSGTELSGFFWLVYNQPHRFHDAEIRFLNTLTGQAVLAVNNSSLYQSAEVGKRRLESVLASTPEPVLVISETGELLLANAAASQLSDIVEMENGGTVRTGEITSKVLNDFISGLGNLPENAQELTLEDGRTYLVSVSRANTEDLNVGKVCVLRDVTDYKKLEKLKSEYVSTVSHDLKTPLGMIRGYAGMIPMVGDLNEQQKEYSTKIIEEIDKISQMANNILDLSRFDSGVEIKLEKLAPYDLIDQVISQLQPQANNRKVLVMKELTLAQELTIEGDRGLLQRALYNLLENAIKFSSIGSQVNLRLESRDETVIFVIQDHGPGIAPIDLPTIFEVTNSPGKTEGVGRRSTGMGLSIVKSIADKHKGRVWVESILGKGSIFYLQIPLKVIEKIRRKYI